MFDLASKFHKAFLRDSRDLAEDIRMRDPFEYYVTKGGTHLVMDMTPGHNYRYWEFRNALCAVRCLRWKMARVKLRPSEAAIAWHWVKRLISTSHQRTGM